MLVEHFTTKCCLHERMYLTGAVERRAFPLKTSHFQSKAVSQGLIEKRKMSTAFNMTEGSRITVLSGMTKTEPDFQKSTFD